MEKKFWNNFINSQDTFYQVLRFLIVGGITSLSYIVPATFVEYFGAADWLAVTIGAIVSSIIGYLGHKYITYASDGEHLPEIVKSLLKHVFDYVYAQAFTYFVCSVLLLPFFVASLGVPATLAVIGFPIYKYWVYK